MIEQILGGKKSLKNLVPRVIKIQKQNLQTKKQERIPL